MEAINPLKNINRLDGGIDKQWIWQWGNNFSRSCDYLQKINFCIQDLNREIDSLYNSTMKDVIYRIVLIDWIREAVNEIPKLLIEELEHSFVYEKELEIDIANKFFTAVRSFVVAHPLSTSRHKTYGFDGDKICVDIQSNLSAITKQLTANAKWYHLDLNGLKPCSKDTPYDFVLFIYSNHNNMQFFEYIGVEYSDLFHVAELQIDKLYALDNHLKHYKKKDLINRYGVENN